MIHYALRCAASHDFDGWFASSAAFDAQAAGGLVECPRCGSIEIDRGLMAPRVARLPAGGTPAKPGPMADAPAVPKAATPAMPAELRAGLMRLRENVERTCDFVGADFPDQARRMHMGEVEPRGIYGHGTETEMAQLREDGVQIASLPWIDRADS